VERTHSEDIKQFALSLLGQEGFLHACYEQKLAPLSEPKIENQEIKLDGTYSCDVFLEVKPSITPSGYLGMALEKPEIDMDNIVESLWKELREQHVTIKALEEVKENSIVDLDFWLLVDGKEILSSPDQKFMIKAGQEPPFGENLFGIKRGEMASATITLPENYEEHAGKEADVKMDIKMVTERVEPTDEELITRTSSESYEDLLEKVTQRAQEIANGQSRQILEEKIIDKLIEMHDFEVPESWVQDEEKYLFAQFGANMVKIDDEITEHVRKMADRNVRRTFIMESIYDAEKELAITQEELDAFLEQEAEQLGVSVVSLKSDLKKKGMADGVYAVIKHRKIIEMILSQARIDEPASASLDEPDMSNMSEIPDNPLG
jgi:trigger factor